MTASSTGADRSAGRLRLARLGRGMSQEQLARASGVSRQAIAGVESGRWSPSLKVAMAIARALESNVEEIFGTPLRDSILSAELALPAPPGGRVLLAEVGTTTVAYPLGGDGAMSCGFRSASAVITDHQPRSGPVLARTLGRVRPTLLLAGCDPAIPLLAQQLGHFDPPVRLAWLPCGSQRALELLHQGMVHAAGIHIYDNRLGSYNSLAARAALTEVGARLVGFAVWRQGLLLAPKLARLVRDLADVADLGARLVNREPGSEARSLLEREMGRLKLSPDQLDGFNSNLSGHLLVASAIAAGIAGAGVASEPAALTYGLPFLPLSEDRYDIVIPEALVGTIEVQALVRALGSRELKNQLDAIPGYGTSVLGEVADSF